MSDEKPTEPVCKQDTCSLIQYTLELEQRFNFLYQQATVMNQCLAVCMNPQPSEN